MKKFYKTYAWLFNRAKNLAKILFLFKIVFHQDIIYIKGEVAKSLNSFQGFR